MEEIKKWIFQNRWIIIILTFVTLAAHGSILFSNRFGIDTDIIMRGQHNFLTIGRQGLVWLAELLGIGWFNLYLSQILTIFFMILSPVAFGLLYGLTYGKFSEGGMALLALGCSFIVSPFWTAQIYFLNQSAQVLCAFTLTAVTIFVLEYSRKDLRKRWYLTAAVLLTQLTFSCYQVLVLVYIAGTATVFLVWMLAENRTWKQALRWIGFHVVFFVAGLLMYVVTSAVFFMSGGNYLGDQIAWKGIKGLITACRSAAGILRQSSPYYTGMYGVFCLLFLGLVCWQICKDKSREIGSALLMALAALCLAASPAFLCVLYSGLVWDRVQLLLPFAQGSMLYLAFIMLSGEEMRKTRRLSCIARAICVILGIGMYRDTVWNMGYCNRLYYTDEWVYQYSVHMAEELSGEIRALQYGAAEAGISETGRDNVILLGRADIPMNSACVYGHVIGYSLFNYEKVVNLDPAYWARYRYFMENLGYSFDFCLTQEEIDAFHAHFADWFGEEVDAMPSYPDPGYAEYVLDEETGLSYLVVKMGEDWR